MNLINIKICGITSTQQALEILRCGVERIGLIYYRNSARNIDLQRAANISDSIKTGRPLVLVFVDEKLDDLVRIYRRLSLRTCRLQLHGRETPEYIDALRQRLRDEHLQLPEIVRRISSINERNRFFAVADKLLWETPGENPGGNGILSAWPPRIFFTPSDRYIIAGGINADNVVHSIERTGVYEVDLAGSVEISPGNKSLKKVVNFVRVVRKYERLLSKIEMEKMNNEK